MSPRQYQPTPKERDERVNTEHEPEELIRAVLKAGPHPKEDEKRRIPRAEKDSSDHTT